LSRQEGASEGADAQLEHLRRTARYGPSVALLSRAKKAAVMHRREDD